MTRAPLVKKLLNRGDLIEMIQGKIVIEPASQRPVPPSWLKTHQYSLAKELAQITGQDIFTYDSYSTGRYGPKKCAGVQLQFESLRTGEFYYCVFNADLNRSRSSKQGKANSPLPKGKFKVGKRSAFYQFWLNSGLKLPPRLSSFHDYMGNLRQCYFVAIKLDEQKLDKRSIAPCEIPFVTIIDLLGYGDKPALIGCDSSTVYGEPCNDSVAPVLPTTLAQNDRSPSYDQDAAVPVHMPPILNDTIKPTLPCEQSHEEWLAAYDSRAE